MPSMLLSIIVLIYPTCLFPLRCWWYQVVSRYLDLDTYVSYLFFLLCNITAGSPWSISVEQVNTTFIFKHFYCHLHWQIVQWLINIYKICSMFNTQYRLCNSYKNCSCIFMTLSKLCGFASIPCLGILLL